MMNPPWLQYLFAHCHKTHVTEMNNKRFTEGESVKCIRLFLYQRIQSVLIYYCKTSPSQKFDVSKYCVQFAKNNTCTISMLLSDYKDHECVRTCSANTLPKTCEYHFTVEPYHTLTKACFDCPFNQTDCFRPHCVPAQGTERSVVVVNRMMPGPSIQVCIIAFCCTSDLAS